MKCAGCNRELEVGDRYITDTASGFYPNLSSEPVVDGLVAELLSDATGGRVCFCEDCTEPGGDYLFETVYGDEGAAGKDTAA